MEQNKEFYYEFYTEYVSNGKRYGSSVFARNEKEAEILLSDKRLTERILGCDPEKPILLD